MIDIPEPGHLMIPDLTWTEVAGEGGHRTWQATVVRGCPWDRGDIIEHVLYVGHDAGGDYLWQTVYSDRAGPNVDAAGYVDTFDQAITAAAADLATQPHLGVEPVHGPAIIRCPSVALHGANR